MSVSIAARREIVAVCRRLYERGLIAGPDGNVSVRLASDRILVTPAGMSKVEVQDHDLVELSLDGTHYRGSRRASSEIAMHLRIYRKRPDIHAVVHAHPPIATGFAVAGESFAQCVLPEMIFQVGWVPLVPYALPGSEEVADRLEPFLANHDAFLLANHGATTLGANLVLAHQRMESLEHTARIMLTARLLGRVNTLRPDDVEALVAARQRTAPGAIFPGCETPLASTRSDA
jgi:L-fuculose-phosphate aldolase